MPSWSELKDDYGSSGGGDSDFLKLEDGEKATLVFVGMPHKYSKQWQNREKPQQRAICNVWHVERERLYAFDLSWWYMRQVRDIAEEIDVSTQKIRVTRTGTREDTNYTFIPIGPAPEGMLATISAVEPHDIVRMVEPRDSGYGF